MTAKEFVGLYERDIQKLIEEIRLFQHEENIWKTSGAIKNPAGNLALHITGGLNFLIGATMANTGYNRNRDQEFSATGIDRNSILQDLQDLIPLISDTVGSMSNEQLNASYPRFFDKENATISYVLTQLLLHLNYHTGQINYIRRMLE